VKKYQLLTIQMIAYFSMIPMIIYGSLNEWLILLLMYFLMFSLGSTICYHRYLTHRSFKCSKITELILLFFGHINLAGSAVSWVAMHREHHRFSDTEKDPHSPEHKGYLRTQFFHTLYEMDMKYVRDLIRNKPVVMEHKHYWKLTFLWFVILLLIDPFSVIYAWLAPAGLSRLAIGMIISYSHRDGYAHNDEWLGWLTFGEGWHGNHHKDPTNPSCHPTKDISGWIIKFIRSD